MVTMPGGWRLCAWALAAVIAGPPAQARISRIVIASDESPTFAGASFGSAGSYEKILGTAYGLIDPKDRHNSLITDIDRAPQDANGMVAYAMPFYILKPVTLSAGNRMLFFDVLNRGNPVLPAFNVGAAGLTAAGDGFLEAQGYTLVGSGWEGDLPPTATFGITLPVATQRDGSPITGPVMGSWEPFAPATTQTLPYAASAIPQPKAVLTRRVLQADPPEVIPQDQWAFADCTTLGFPGSPSATKLCLQGGFDTDHIYELVYQGANPTVLGLGFAATRDLVSFLRTAVQDDVGTPNPLAGGIDYALAFGVSQTARYLRSFTHLGFNESEPGARVFDGLDMVLGALQIPLNVRFAQPTLIGLQHEEHDFPIAESPFTWQTRLDPVAGYSDGLLRRCAASATCPKIVQQVTDTEYWQYRMSLDTTDGLGTDLPSIPGTVRIYHFASVAHVSGTVYPACQLAGNPTSYQDPLRALSVRLQEWVAYDSKPPASAYAKVADGTLTTPDQASIGFPTIPGFTYNGRYDALGVLYRGPRFDATDESGIMRVPPVALSGHDYTVLLPRVDADGNTVDGVRITAIQAPLGTYTGWALRKAGFAEGDLCALQGSFLPFATTQADRMAAGDPRLSLQERYGDHAGYVAAVSTAAAALVRQGFMLPVDAQRQIQAAAASSVLR